MGWMKIVLYRTQLFFSFHKSRFLLRMTSLAFTDKGRSMQGAVLTGKYDDVDGPRGPRLPSTEVEWRGRDEASDWDGPILELDLISGARASHSRNNACSRFGRARHSKVTKLQYSKVVQNHGRCFCNVQVGVETS